MSALKEPGWYYVGGGQLRYHDEFGWTEFEMDTHDDRALDWPPPAPSTILRSMRAEEDPHAVAAAPRGGFVRGLWRRPRAGRRSVA
jgi:hypothetical protein